ncbi:MULTISPECIES: Zn-ribbon domain-containing OB-fold protein [unclassified Pseudofrankia]|uniref:Zn-ribbon domain-containing OB-fold protein n=1 Tax=unclassified Pseudofrankia TaxID=2994372 RepID=UPI0008DA0D3D|nr:MULTISPECIES: Zn-ribbon domain-containing OB-fold protein [unclassified Pseudofrankia]MDT3440201.1 Zn-ribbon domain-containing OB-fold protein [Pseudofrankia sp. BMG5.37]OHV42661.1 nucleic acid-binding protein [Pseudofrankia sp. BMG5.36]
MRPSTVVTDDSAIFWDAAAEGRLVAQRCGGCGVLRHPPRPMCPHCQSLDYKAEQLSGRGALYSYALLHHPRNPAFDYPVLAALVDLDEGIRLVSNLVDVAPGDIRIGMRLEVAFEPTAGDGSVPVFRPARSAS